MSGLDTLTHTHTHRTTTVTLAAHARRGLINPRRACAARVTVVVLGSVLLYDGGERGRKRGEREEGQSANLGGKFEFINIQK